MEESRNRNGKPEKAPAMAVKLTAGAGGGIGGIVFLGGALVAATLVSAFAFKRVRTRRIQGPPSVDSDDNPQSRSPPPPAMIDLPSDLEMMMKSSKDHHQLISKGLSFLLPADSSLPIIHKIPSDAKAHEGVTQIQVLISDDEKPKIRIINEEPERAPLFANSDLTVAGEEFSSPVVNSPSLSNCEKVMEFSNLDLESVEEPQNSMGSDRESFCSKNAVLSNHQIIMNTSEFATEHFSISVESIKLMEGANEESNATPGDGDQVVIEEKEEIYDAIMQEMMVEDEVEIVHDDQLVADEEEKEIKLCEDQEMIKNCDENIGVAREGEAIELSCEHVAVREDIPEMQLVGQEQEVKAMKVVKEEGIVKPVSIDQIEAEDVMQGEPVDLIGLKEEGEDSAERSKEKCEEEIVETAAHAVDQIVKEDDQQMLKCGGGDDCERETSTEANIDQVAEEHHKEVPITDIAETITNHDEEPLQSDNLISFPIPTEVAEVMQESDESIKSGSLDQKEEEDKPDVKFIIEEECNEEDNEDFITKECEHESIEVAHADVFGESLANSMQLADADENNNSEKGPLSTEEEKMDEVSEVASVDKVRVEDNITIQLPETPAITEEAVEKIWVEENPRMELSENEKAGDGDGDDNYEDEDGDNAEKGEESSERTGDSYAESNSDANWSAKSTQELAPEFNNLIMKGELPNMSSSKGSGNVANGCDYNANEDEAVQRYVAAGNQGNQRLKEPWKMRTRTRSILVSLWCLCHWYMGLPLVKVSLIAMVISIVVLCAFSSHVLTKNN